MTFATAVGAACGAAAQAGANGGGANGGGSAAGESAAGARLMPPPLLIPREETAPVAPTLQAVLPKPTAPAPVVTAPSPPDAAPSVALPPPPAPAAAAPRPKPRHQYLVVFDPELRNEAVAKTLGLYQEPACMLKLETNSATDTFVGRIDCSGDRDASRPILVSLPNFDPARLLQDDPFDRDHLHLAAEQLRLNGAVTVHLRNGDGETSRTVMGADWLGWLHDATALLNKAGAQKACTTEEPMTIADFLAHRDIAWGPCGRSGSGTASDPAPTADSSFPFHSATPSSRKP